MPGVRRTVTSTSIVGKRHHFVPRFYLEAFSSSPRRIGLVNLKRCQLITAASLRDQCYAHRLYGADNVIETALGQIEDASAAVFRTLRNRRVIPGGGTPQRDVLNLFIGLQLARTTAAQAHAVEESRLFADVAFEGSPPPGYEMSAVEAMRLTLSIGPTMAATIRDLAVTLILARSGTSFATSDNPVFRYNSYCEGIFGAGVTGTQCGGLQLFLPVSPELLLYFFDPAVYKLARSSQRFASATQHDMEAINRLQLVAAHENVYFDTPELGDWLLASASAVQAIRQDTKAQLTQAVEVGGERSELLHQYRPMPQLGLELSFVSIRRRALDIPLDNRVRQPRGPYRSQDWDSGPPGGVRTFEVRSHHRSE